MPSWGATWCPPDRLALIAASASAASIVVSRLWQSVCSPPRLVIDRICSEPLMRQEILDRGIFGAGTDQ